MEETILETLNLVGIADLYCDGDYTPYFILYVDEGNGKLYGACVTCENKKYLVFPTDYATLIEYLDGKRDLTSIMDGMFVRVGRLSKNGMKSTSFEVTGYPVYGKDDSTPYYDGKYDEDLGCTGKCSMLYIIDKQFSKVKDNTDKQCVKEKE